MAHLLQLDQATIRFGGLCAVNAVDLVIAENELIGLIGPIGCGKSTVAGWLPERGADHGGQHEL